MRILTTLLIVTLLYACCEKSETELTTFKVIQGAKCTDETPTDGTCPAGEAVGLIELDTDGNPSAVNIINACEDKKVTWKYKNEYAGGDAPPFMVVFDPSIYPGKSYKVLSKPTPDAKNQEFTLNTRKLKGEKNECLNYAVMIPGKGLLDPIFILKR